eukprot:TRINITY_DN5263_c2_g1_i3.p1 TRINITY_DN5263_c2_g1~~TRINITY_DN5263_c2_g1_i3.p1  ORF type:complete len:106 (-),score=4.06 TRINITY_DN5263_c2_g1_i3:37-354(-)
MCDKQFKEFCFGLRRKNCSNFPCNFKQEISMAHALDVVLLEAGVADPGNNKRTLLVNGGITTRDDMIVTAPNLLLYAPTFPPTDAILLVHWAERKKNESVGCFII